MSSEFIDAIRQRSQEEEAKVSQWFKGHPRLLEPAASKEMLASEEQLLSFSIQPFLRQLYLEIGNGDFGPGCDIFGVTGGRSSSLGHLAETYQLLIGNRSDNFPDDDWHEKLLPFADYGCNGYGLVDCDNGDIYYLDNASDELTDEGYDVEEYFQLWLDGQNLH